MNPQGSYQNADPVSVGLGGTWDLCISHQPQVKAVLLLYPPIPRARTQGIMGK